MMMPTIHINGTSAKELLEQLRNASVAVREARGALQQAAPHGRDYYPQGHDASSRQQKSTTTDSERLLRFFSIWIRSLNISGKLPPNGI